MRYPGGLSKALTFSYDDGMEQDAELIRILDDHGMKATFNLNTGLFATAGQESVDGPAHRRLSLEAALEIYKGSSHEVAVHCLTHASLTDLPTVAAAREILKDKDNLEHAFGGIVRGLAYPFGTFDNQVIDVLRTCGILYARTITSSHSHVFPKDWLRLDPTCHHNDPQLMPLAERFFMAKPCFDCKLFYVWGHSFEFERDNNWGVIKRFTDVMAEHDGIWYATNGEIFSYAWAWKQLIVSADGNVLYNPTATSLWFDVDGQLMIIEPGETKEIG